MLGRLISLQQEKYRLAGEKIMRLETQKSVAYFQARIKVLLIRVIEVDLGKWMDLTEVLKHNRNALAKNWL